MPIPEKLSTTAEKLFARQLKSNPKRGAVLVALANHDSRMTAEMLASPSLMMTRSEFRKYRRCREDNGKSDRIMGFREWAAIFKAAGCTTEPALMSPDMTREELRRSGASRDKLFA
jgi:hypothetical protein